jgi:RHS repeat-associated protein
VEYSGSGTSSRTWLLADERGSITARTDSTGAATAINSYDEYGNPDASNIGRFGYTGQIWLADAGVWHYKARAYHPGLGRFMQTDPIGQAGGMNIYAYVGGDPVNMVDPSGLLSCIVNGNNQGDCRYRRYSSGLGGLYSGFTSSFSRIGVDISGLDPLAGGPRLRAGRDSEGGEPSCNQTLMDVGNALAVGANGFAEGSFAVGVFGAGVVGLGLVAGVVGAPAIVGGSLLLVGVAAIQTAGAGGLFGAGLQVLSGAAHFFGGGSGRNAVTALPSAAAGYTIGRFFRAGSGNLSNSERVQAFGQKIAGALTGFGYDVGAISLDLGAREQNCATS